MRRLLAEQMFGRHVLQPSDRQCGPADPDRFRPPATRGRSESMMVAVIAWAINQHGGLRS